MPCSSAVRKPGFDGWTMGKDGKKTWQAAERLMEIMAEKWELDVYS